VIRDIVISISKDASHKNGGNATSIVRLHSEVDNSYYSTNENVQASASNTSRRSNVDREADEVLDGTAAVEHNHNSQNGRADDSGDHPMPPEKTD
jgi:hypothetical protein